MLFLLCRGKFILQEQEDAQEGPQQERERLDREAEGPCEPDRL